VRRESRVEREAWTAFIEGRKQKPSQKYRNERTEGFASRYEAEIAAKLAALERSGQISDLRFQVPLVLVEGNGKIRAIKYVADFTYIDRQGKKHWVDAKGCKTPMYRLKRKLAILLHGIEIEEV
jgi:hypothetical protein